jgi:hypothetical protein
MLSSPLDQDGDLKHSGTRCEEIWNGENRCAVAHMGVSKPVSPSEFKNADTATMLKRLAHTSSLTYGVGES